MKLIIFSLTFVFCIQARTLILIGGGERPQSALHYFLSFKKAGPIYVLPWGTRYPVESYQSIKEELELIGAKDIRCFCDSGFSAQDLINLRKAGALYFPGGNQNRVMEKINRYNLKNEFLNLYNQDIPIAGTSAGTAIQSERMLTGNASESVIGLGTLDGFIVDQHYLVRSRQERLLGALELNPTFNGLGVDEDMSVAIINDQVFTALGPSSVLIYQRVGNQLKVKELKDGETLVFTR